MARGYKKVPVILQMEALECGAASLAMILAYYKRYIPLEQLRVDCGISRDGSKASNLVKAARFHGMEAKGYRYSIEKIQSLKTFPVIIHWEFNHFVVLDGFKRGRAVINDPASGIVEVPIEEFEKSFTGVTIVMKPTKDFEPFGKPKSIWSFLGNYIAIYKSAFLAILLCGFLIALLGIATPVFSKVFMDYVLLSSAEEWMNYLLKAMLIVLAMLFFLKMLLALLLYRAKQVMGLHTNVAFLLHTLCLPVSFYQQRSPGDISARQMDNEVVTTLLFERLLPVLIDVFMAIIYFVILLILNPLMSLIAFLVMLTQMITMKVMAEKNQIESKNISRDEGKYISAAMSGVSMIETIKASGAEEGYFRKIAGYLTKYHNSKTKLQTRMLITNFLPELLNQLCNAFILITGVYYILDGDITIGLLMAFQGFLAQFLSPISAVLEAGNELQEVTSKLERMEDVLNYSTDVELSVHENTDTSTDTNAEQLADIKYERLTGKLEFQKICFAYGPLSPPFIENFSMVIEPGQMVAFVGGSGSGKSTIANLIIGIFSLRSGSILFDGKERQEIDRYVFTQNVSIVNQTISIFHDSIRNNLTLWDNSIEEQVLIDACKSAGIYEDIMMRPEGLDYVLTEGGKNLSGGQRQRLEIARALIKNPSILILDEATSALDPPTEKRIMDTVKKMKITCIIIAHRLSTIRSADKIIMLEQGHIIEMGTHESLLKAEGAYARLVQSE